MKKSKYLKRLDAVNETGDKTLLDCIDRPMRRICFELNRVGFQTHFSCCGFEYPEQEQPKSHIYSKTNGIYAYVLFSVLKNKIALDNLIKINNYCEKNDYVSLTIPKLNPIINLVICPDKVGFGFYSKELKLSVHDYEFVIVGIMGISEFIQNNIKTVNDPVIFKDGNRYWGNIENWQVTPKPDFEIGVNDFYDKYGKNVVQNIYNDPNFLRFDNLTCVNLKD